MRCIRHATKMVKHKWTGIELCLMCDKIDEVIDDLHDMGEWDYTVKDVESYLKGPDRANLGEHFSKKEKESDE